jgi:hypothetical protein
MLRAVERVGGDAVPGPPDRIRDPLDGRRWAPSSPVACGRCGYGHQQGVCPACGERIRRESVSRAGAREFERYTDSKGSVMGDDRQRAREAAGEPSDSSLAGAIDNATSEELVTDPRREDDADAGAAAEAPDIVRAREEGTTAPRVT